MVKYWLSYNIMSFCFLSGSLRPQRSYFELRGISVNYEHGRSRDKEDGTNFIMDFKGTEEGDEAISGHDNYNDCFS